MLERYAVEGSWFQMMLIKDNFKDELSDKLFIIHFDSSIIICIVDLRWREDEHKKFETDLENDVKSFC